MQYLGIDIAKYHHVLASVFDDGTVHGKPFEFANTQAGFKGLLDRFKELEVDPDDSIVAMESTGHYWVALWSFLGEHGYKVAIVNPVLTDAFRKANTVRKTKTDTLDALTIAEFARFKHLGPTQVTPEDADGLKQLTRFRSHLVSERTSLKNRATAAADRLFPELASCFSSKSSATYQALLREFGSAEKIASTDIRTLAKAITQASHGRFGKDKAEEVKALAKSSVGSSYAAEALAYELSQIMGLIGYLDDQVDELDLKIAEMLDPEIGELLQTIPGIGPVTAAAIVAEVGDPNRFDDPRQLVAYAGIDASKSQSGTFDGTGQHMSKRGSSYLRYALLLAADKARMNDPYFGDYYDSMKARGKHHYVALSGVTRKLCGVILAILRDKRPYEPRPSIQSQQQKKLES